MRAPLPANEDARLAALRACRVLDTPPEQEYDDLVRLAFVCGTSIAAVSLVDRDRQWFKARVGLDVTETSREHAFCAHVVHEARTLVVNDASKDVRFADNPFVIAEGGVRFYAGAPLRTPEGHALGTLCVVDVKPRELSAEQKDALEALARQTQTLLEVRRALAALRAASEEVRVLSGLLRICSGCKNIRQEDGTWRPIESYVRERSEADFSHGLCPECRERLYPGS